MDIILEGLFSAFDAIPGWRNSRGFMLLGIGVVIGLFLLGWYLNKRACAAAARQDRIALNRRGDHGGYRSDLRTQAVDPETDVWRQVGSDPFD